MEQSLKIYYIYKTLLFPYCVSQFPLKTKSGVTVNENLIIYPVRNILDLLLYRKNFATLATVTKIIDENENSVFFEARGNSLIRITERKWLFSGKYETIKQIETDEAAFFVEQIRKKAQEFVFLIDIGESEKLIYLINFINKLNELTDFISHYFVTDLEKKWSLYREPDLKVKSEKLITFLDEMITKIRTKLDRKIFEKKSQK